MAIISPSTFDPLRRYISVRLQQGVPIVDADWNEMEDIRRFELRAFLKWFVGDGVPDGVVDAFRIVGTGATNTFTITAGGGAEGLRAGRYLVDGLDVFITASIGFAAQPLHSSQPGAAALAARWGVPVIAALPVPPPAGTTRTLTVYVDVWERLVGTAEEPSLVHPGLGTESCVRIRREWVVRVREGSAVPVSGNPDFLPNHAYSALARITQDSTGVINDANIIDLRQRGLKLLSRFDLQQLVSDAFGERYALAGDGQPALQVSLREALNAVTCGRLPMTSEIPLLDSGMPFPFIHGINLIPHAGRPAQEVLMIWSGAGKLQSMRATLAGPLEAPVRITTDNATEAGSFVLQDGQTTWLFWKSDRKSPGMEWQVYTRQRLTGREWGPIQELGDARVPGTPQEDQSAELSAFRDPLGQIWFTWVHRDGLVRLRRFSGSSWGATERVSVHANRYAGTFSESSPTLTAFSDNTMVVLWEDRPPGSSVFDRMILLRAYVRDANNNWIAQTARRYTSDSFNEQLPQTFSDGQGNMWVFWRSLRQKDSRSAGWFQFASQGLSRISPLSDGIESGPIMNLSIESGRSVPIVLDPASGQFHIFFEPQFDGRGLRYKTYNGLDNTLGMLRDVPTLGRLMPFAVAADGAGGAWLAYFRRRPSGSAEFTLRKIYSYL